jgi:hypothetical protein
VYVKPAEQFYSELSETYQLCIETTVVKERLIIPFNLIETIQMKNIVLKEFVVTWSSHNEGS